MRRMGLGHLITELSVEMPPTKEEGSCMSGKPLATPDTAYSESRDEGYLNKMVLLDAHVAWERQAPKGVCSGSLSNNASWALYHPLVHKCAVMSVNGGAFWVVDRLLRGCGIANSTARPLGLRSILAQNWEEQNQWYMEYVYRMHPSLAKDPFASQVTQYLWCPGTNVRYVTSNALETSGTNVYQRRAPPRSQMLKARKGAPGMSSVEASLVDDPHRPTMPWDTRRRNV